jgi:polyadenylate-binding protein
VLQDQKTERNFGFVNFETASAAAAAKDALHDKEIDGRKLFVDRAQTKAERQDLLKRRYEQKRSALAQEWEGKNVYVKNLSADTDESLLKEAFQARAHCALAGA